MYAKTNPEDVFSILKKYNASYIILEDSICLAHRERCSLPDILDLANGHVRLLSWCSEELDNHFRSLMMVLGILPVWWRASFKDFVRRSVYAIETFFYAI